MTTLEPASSARPGLTEEQRRTAVVGHEPHNPVRDDSLLAPNEDLDREPDGMPHSVIGMTAGFAVMFAALIAFMMLVGSGWTRVLGIALCFLAIPVVVGSLRKKAATARDSAQPAL